MSMAAYMHDQGGLAWLIVGAYLTGALLTLRAGAVSAGRERKLWLATGVALILLGINKQLDFQSDLTWAAKIAAHKQGWYDWRRDVQGAFLLLMGLGAAGFSIFLWRSLRTASTNAKVAAVGLVILLAFIVIRAASFHHIDYWVTVHIAGMRSGWWLELLGIALISAAAVSSRGRPQDSQVSSS
jgi:hypothetical protein